MWFLFHKLAHQQISYEPNTSEFNCIRFFIGLEIIKSPRRFELTSGLFTFMPTLHERLSIFESENRFWLLTKHRLVVGRLVKKEWDKYCPGGQLPQVLSMEPNGTFQVYLYPDDFTEKIDQIIVDYANLITTPKPRKEPPKKVEKPKQMKHDLPKTASSEPQRKRTRKPISQPAFSGRQLKK